VDGFEIAVRAVLGQQVTVKSAATLARRFVEAFGDPIETPDARLTRLFPRATAIAALDYARIAELGIIASRAQAIVSLAREITAGRLRLDTSADVNETMAALERIDGIGPWTAQYIAMRALSWPDAFPHPDVAVLKALKEKRPRAALAFAERWRPWRAYAVLHLWRKLA
jgi:AraC family transcriptional regulator of adaptative response / DNA-3-methyladenine glycosylase II